MYLGKIFKINIINYIKSRYFSLGSSDVAAKKSKIVAYKPPAEIAKKMKLDTGNKKLWDEAMSHAKEGSQAFLAEVQEIFACICCQDLVFQPVTTECKHNFCKVGRDTVIMSCR